MNVLRFLRVSLFSLPLALPALAQTGLPTLSRQIAPQILNRGPVQIDLTSHFGVPGVTGQVVQISTTLGKVNVEMQATEAPRNVANFLSYVAKNAYDNTLIHRVDNLNAVVPSIVHGGGFAAATIPPVPASIERGAPVALEYRLPLVRGTLAAWHNAGEPNGATSEWFFNTVDNSSALSQATDGGYTVFGRVLGTGMSVVDAIAQVPVVNLQGTSFSKMPLRNFSTTQTQITAANLITVTSARVIPIYPPAVGDPSSLLSFAVSSPPTVGIISTSITGSTLTITPLAVGTVTLTVRATDSNGNLSLPTTFEVSVPPESLLAPLFTSHPVSQSVATGSTVVLQAQATGGATDIFPLTYQWTKNGTPISAPSSPFLIVRSATAGDAGTYTCRATNSLGTSVSLPATLSVAPAAAYEKGRLVNLAVRADADEFFETLIVGFAIGDNKTSGAKPLLVRGAGPSLTPLGVRDVMPDPVLKVFSNGTLLASNDNWLGDSQISARASQVGAFAYTGPTSLDAAVALTSYIGSYTVQLNNKVAGRGTVLAEIYDATPAQQIVESTPRLVNLSARSRIGADRSILIAGFVISGTTPATVLVRAVGPALTAFGVDEAAADPKLQLFRGTSFVSENDDWNGDAQIAALAKATGAFALPAAGSKDSVMLLTLAPGTYTAQVSDATSKGGIALIEVYEIR